MNELLRVYKRLLEERLEKKRLLHLGEDSIRYDFFASLMEYYNFKPCQIQIEQAIDRKCFIPNNERISFRNEKPLIDLVVDEPTLKVCIEFGLFRENSNAKGSINKTARIVKMLNDMIRLALQAHFTGFKAFFICIADYKMLGHQLRTRLLPSFPSDYTITNDILNRQLKQRTNNFDKRFLKVFQPMNKLIEAKLIFREDLKALYISEATELLVWEVKLC